MRAGQHLCVLSNRSKATSSSEEIDNCTLKLTQCHTTMRGFHNVSEVLGAWEDSTSS